MENYGHYSNCSIGLGYGLFTIGSILPLYKKKIALYCYSPLKRVYSPVLCYIIQLCINQLVNLLHQEVILVDLQAQLIAAEKIEVGIKQTWGQFNSGFGTDGQFRNWNCLFKKKWKLNQSLLQKN